jgi:hypothetical protein
MTQALTLSEAFFGLLSTLAVIGLAYATVWVVWSYVAGRVRVQDIPVAPEQSSVAFTERDLRVTWQLAIMEDKRREMEQRGVW